MATIPAYTVHGKSMTVESRLNDAGTNIEDVHVVPYTITSGPAKGAKRHVKVPHDEFQSSGADAVRQAIEDDAAKVHAVANLGTPGTM